MYISSDVQNIINYMKSTPQTPEILLRGPLYDTLNTHSRYYIDRNHHSTDYLSNNLFSFKMQKETESHAEHAIMERP